jgi:hypothetical protein
MACLKDCIGEESELFAMFRTHGLIYLRHRTQMFLQILTLILETYKVQRVGFAFRKEEKGPKNKRLKYA